MEDLQTRSEAPQKERRSHEVPVSNILKPSILIPIANYGILALVEIMFFILLSIFLATPINIGGLGFKPAAIGIAIGLEGLVTGICVALFFAKLRARLGSKKIVTIGMSSFVIMYALFPVMNAVAKRSGEVVTPLVIVLLVIQLLLALPVSMTWS
jgi:hypothetical protein